MLAPGVRAPVLLTPTTVMLYCSREARHDGMGMVAVMRGAHVSSCYQTTAARQACVGAHLCSRLQPGHVHVWGAAGESQRGARLLGAVGPDHGEHILQERRQGGAGLRKAVCKRRQAARAQSGAWASRAVTFVKAAAGSDRAVAVPVEDPVALAWVSSRPGGMTSGSQLSLFVRFPSLATPSTVTLYCRGGGERGAWAARCTIVGQGGTAGRRRLAPTEHLAVVARSHHVCPLHARARPPAPPPPPTPKHPPHPTHTYHPHPPIHPRTPTPLTVAPGSSPVRLAVTLLLEKVRGLHSGQPTFLSVNTYCAAGGRQPIILEHCCRAQLPQASHSPSHARAGRRWYLGEGAARDGAGCSGAGGGAHGLGGLQVHADGGGQLQHVPARRRLARLVHAHHRHVVLRGSKANAGAQPHGGRGRSLVHSVTPAALHQPAH
jgi:hypothetical protein